MITKEKLNESRIHLAKDYFRRGKLDESLVLMGKVVKGTTSKTYEARKNVTDVADFYNKLGLKNKANKIFKNLVNDEWGECELELIKKIKPDFLRKPDEVLKMLYKKEDKSDEVNIQNERFIENLKKNSERDLIIFANFFFEQKKFPDRALACILEFNKREKEEGSETRKRVYDAYNILKKMEQEELSEKFKRELLGNKYGECEYEFVNKILSSEGKVIKNDASAWNTNYLFL